MWGVYPAKSPLRGPAPCEASGACAPARPLWAGRADRGDGGPPALPQQGAGGFSLKEREGRVRGLSVGLTADRGGRGLYAGGRLCGTDPRKHPQAVCLNEDQAL